MGAFTLSLSSEGQAVLTFDLQDEKVNKLTSAVMAELKDLLLSLNSRKDISVLIIKSPKPGMFIAGADINEIKDITDQSDALRVVQEGQAIFNLLAALPFPTVAAIQGVCMGGGTELALACDYRVMSDHSKAMMALPEVKLGIIPGFGGTQRLPRLIGLQQGLPLILTGKTVTGKKAVKIKLVDATLSEVFFEEQLQGFVKNILSDKGQQQIKGQRKVKGLLNRFLENSFLGRRLIFSKAQKQLEATTKGHYPAPVAALAAVKKGLSRSLVKGLHIEAKYFSQVATSSESKSLIHLFFLMEAAKKYTGVEGKVTFDEISETAVLGAGLMGGGIAGLLTQQGYHAKMKDINHDAIILGYQQAKKVSDGLVKRRRLTPFQANLSHHRLEGTTSYQSFDKTDIVIEAIVENMEIKKKVLSELETHVAKDTIMASNTSSLSITEMGSVLKQPGRFVGMHFFSPVHKMPLVEIIPGEKSTKKTIASTVALAKKLKKTPIVVQNCPGFLVNRILIPYVNEAIRCLVDGESIETIDQSALQFGMPIGPLALADEVGLDVGYKVSEVLEKGYGDRMALPDFFKDMMSDDSLRGKKSGAGFYVYKGKDKTVNDALIKKLNRKPQSLGYDDIRDRLILIMVNEAARCLEEGVVESPDLLDLAMVMGTGFPPFRGGLMKYADAIGLQSISDRLINLESAYGSRFKVAPSLKKLADNNDTFYKEG